MLAKRLTSRQKSRQRQVLVLDSTAKYDAMEIRPELVYESSRPLVESRVLGHDEIGVFVGVRDRGACHTPETLEIRTKMPPLPMTVYFSRLSIRLSSGIYAYFIR